MNNATRNNNWINEVKISKHFAQRYNERILKVNPSKNVRFRKLKKKICNDMNDRLTEREKECIKLLISNKGTLKIPIDGTNQLVISNHVLVTVY